MWSALRCSSRSSCSGARTHGRRDLRPHCVGVGGVGGGCVGGTLVVAYEAGVGAHQRWGVPAREEPAMCPTRESVTFRGGGRVVPQLGHITPYWGRESPHRWPIHS